MSKTDIPSNVGVNDNFGSSVTCIPRKTLQVWFGDVIVAPSHPAKQENPQSLHAVDVVSFLCPRSL